MGRTGGSKGPDAGDSKDTRQGSVKNDTQGQCKRLRMEQWAG